MPYDQPRQQSFSSCDGVNPADVVAAQGGYKAPKVKVSPANKLQLALSGLGEKEVH